MNEEIKAPLEPALTQAERYALSYSFLILKEHPLLQNEVKNKNFKHSEEFFNKVVRMAEDESTDTFKILYAYKAKMKAKLEPMAKPEQIGNAS